MTEAEFFGHIIDEITVGGALPNLIPERELKRIIKQTEMWFSENYQYAAEEQHYVIQKSSFQSEEFKKNRTIQMPDCVVSVFECREINGVGRLGHIDRDFAEDRLIASEIFLSSFQGDDLVMRTAQYQYFDLTKAFFLEHISYDFNKNTKKVTIKGRDPKVDVFLNTYVRLPINKLFDDIYFLRWCTAEAKKSFGRLVTTYNQPLLGGITINGDSIKSEGEAEIEQLRSTIDTETVPDWFMVFHTHPLSIVFLTSLMFGGSMLLICSLLFLLSEIYNNEKLKSLLKISWKNLKQKLTNLKPRKILGHLFSH